MCPASDHSQTKNKDYYKLQIYIIHYRLIELFSFYLQKYFLKSWTKYFQCKIKSIFFKTSFLTKLSYLNLDFFFSLFLLLGKFPCWKIWSKKMLRRHHTINNYEDTRQWRRRKKIKIQIGKFCEKRSFGKNMDLILHWKYFVQDLRK